MYSMLDCQWNTFVHILAYQRFRLMFVEIVVRVVFLRYEINFLCSSIVHVVFKRRLQNNERVIITQNTYIFFEF